MDEGIEMMQIKKTSFEPRYPWWVKKISIAEDMIVASFQACACGERQHKARFSEHGVRTLQQAKFDLIRQVNHAFKVSLNLLLDILIEFMNMILSFFLSLIKHKVSLFSAHRLRE